MRNVQRTDSPQRGVVVTVVQGLVGDEECALHPRLLHAGFI